MLNGGGGVGGGGSRFKSSQWGVLQEHVVVWVNGKSGVESSCGTGWVFCFSLFLRA